MSTTTQGMAALIGRICFSTIFIVAGYHKLAAYSATVAVMTSKGIPMAEWLIVGAIILELGGGILVLLGYKARLGALMLLLFIIPVSYYFHSFWGYGPEEMVNQMHHFMKNLAMMGGALYIMAFGPGVFSLDKMK